MSSISLGSSCMVVSLLHTSIDCNRSHPIWRLFGFVSLQEFNSDDPRLWFKSNATGNFGILFIITCWMLWRSRNKEVFSDIRWDYWWVVSWIRSLLDVIIKVFPHPSSQNEPRLVTWIPPPTTFIKFNVDGRSFDNPGCWGYGGLFRDHNDNWISDFLGGCGYTNNMNVEL